MGGKSRLNKKPKRMANKLRNDAVQGFASLTRQRNHTRAHKRDRVKDDEKWAQGFAPLTSKDGTK